MNGTYKINGGIPLKGKVNPIPNKNSLLGALPLAVLADEGINILNLPETSDVDHFLNIYKSWGNS